MNSTEKRVAQYIARHHLLEAGDHVLVALSGGADSVALLRLLHTLGYHVEALHCNFHLRGEESDRDEQFVCLLCNALNIPFHVTHFDTRQYASERGISIEMAARDLRYEWFEHMRLQRNACSIAVAHHADDQAETLLLNVIRGTGLRGLCAMHPRNGAVIRPMLGISRADVLKYLEDLGQSYVTDSTNYERDARRNVLRLDVLPLLRTLNPNVMDALTSLAEVARQSLPLYKKGVDEVLCENGVGQSFPLSLLSEDTAMTLLFEWLFGTHFTFDQLQEMISARHHQPGRIWQSETHRVLLDREYLLLQPIAGRPSLEQYEIVVEDVATLGPFSDDCIYCDKALLSDSLTLRYIDGNEHFAPFGMRGKKLVSDFLTNIKMNRFDRERQLGLFCGNTLVWLVGVRADNRYRVSDQTTNIVRIKISLKTTCE